MRLRLILFATGLLLAPFLASAQPIEGLYVSAGIGANRPQSVHANSSTRPPLDGSLNRAWGIDGTGSVGYALGDGWRFELEGDYLQNGIGQLSGATFPVATSGNVHTYGLMANALFDFDIRSRYVFPYLGAGAGYMWSRFNNVIFAATPPRPGFASMANFGTTGHFAWQLIAGLSFPVPNTPGLSLLAQYRFMDITSGETFTGTQVSSAGVAPASLKLASQYSHTFLLGVRYAFHVTPPAPPSAPTPIAAPAPAPSRSYLVFFDWDKATLTNRAREIVRAAAEASTHVQYTQIHVNGYTDTSGSAAYNQALSLRRAQNVAAELVRDGVPKNAIVIRGFGETHLLVPTGPGVREPQNRRVEIIIGG
ncbi:MAG TPA: OmpA family protein [Acetobacteraceae bacterium]|nr:OmpA family protein [Acetobacteraceae bacterium]